MLTRRIGVIGAGVVGLSSAVNILEKLSDVQVTLIAEKFTPDTTSDGAFGIWEPYLLEGTDQKKISQWGDATLKHMVQLAQSEEGRSAGTFLVQGSSIYKHVYEDPPWKDSVLGFRYLTKKEINLYPGHSFGWSYISAATECKFYLPWLTKRFIKNGGIIRKATIKHLCDLSGDYDVVLNCTGLGAKYILNDEKMKPIQGQVIRVRAPWIKSFLNADDEDLYILPGIDSVVLGGTHDTDNSDTNVCLKTKERILRGCQKLMPSLKEAEVIKDWVGLRPGRNGIRLETEIIRNNGQEVKVVHNYGHGGAGITLHWGCALETVDHVQQLIDVKSKNQNISKL